MSRVTGETSGSAWTARYSVKADLPFLQGHFPEMPILPAVAILEASYAFVRSIGGPGAQTVASARHCKFKAPISPGETYLIEASTEREGVWHVTWTQVRDADTAAAEPVVEVGLTTRA